MSVTAPAPDRSAGTPTLSPEAERAKQIQQAEELLFSGPPQTGFAKALFRGEFRSSVIFPYPELPPDERAEAEDAVARVRAFADAEIDAGGHRSRERISPGRSSTASPGSA